MIWSHPPRLRSRSAESVGPKLPKIVVSDTSEAKAATQTPSSQGDRNSGQEHSPRVPSEGKTADDTNMAPRLIVGSPVKCPSNQDEKGVAWSQQSPWKDAIDNSTEQISIGISSLEAIEAIEQAAGDSNYVSNCETLRSDRSSREPKSDLQSGHTARTSTFSMISKTTYRSKMSVRSSQLAEDGMESSSLDASSPQFALQLAVLGLEDRRRRSSVVERDGTLEEFFEVFGELGRGSFGVVVEARCKRTGEMRAVKSVQCNDSDEDGQISRRLQGELEIARRCVHPHIVTLHEALRDQQLWYLVMDLCAGGTLHDKIIRFWDPSSEEAEERASQRTSGSPGTERSSSDDIAVSEDPYYPSSRECQQRGLPSRLVAMYTWQMLAGIAYLHHHRYCHRDIKAENYLIESTVDRAPLRLTDFGLSKNFARCKRMSSQVGTPYTCAPEVFSGSYDEKCDIWSVGVVCFMCCTGRWPFHGKTPEETTLMVQTATLSYIRDDWKWHPSAARALVWLLLTRDPVLRPSAKQVIVDNAWLQSVNGVHMKSQRGSHPCCSVS